MSKNLKIKRNTKEEIIQVAIDLFSENGVNAVSIRDITRKVGINESSLYNHFNSKDELLEFIIEKFKQEFGEVSFIEEDIEEKLNGIELELFFQNHLLSLRDKITPMVQKIWKTIYMEQFRDKRARDFVIKEIFGRPAAYYKKVFRIMAEKDLIKSIDPGILSDEYNYALMGFSLERMLLETDNEDATLVVKKMFEHIKFICEAIRK